MAGRHGLTAKSEVEFELVLERIQLLLVEEDRVQFLNSRDEIVEVEELFMLQHMATDYAKRIERGQDVLLPYLKVFLTRQGASSDHERTAIYRRFFRDPT